jgi:SAM-dependent methyltransferase
VNGDDGIGVPWDPQTPNAARIYDYILGGKDNYPADRDLAENLLRLMPEVKGATLANRAFLGRAVRLLAERGVDQFLDLGSGLPTQENVHRVAHRVNPEARVVYVDYDALVVTHGRALLETSPNVGIAVGDLRKPGDILRSPDVLGMIDFTRPVTVLMVAVLHFLTDDEDPAGAVASLRRQMAPGSHLVITHVCGDQVDPGRLERAKALYNSASAPVIPRPEAQIATLFEGFDLLDPGLVEVSQWRPSIPRLVGAHAESGRGRFLGGVGRLPTAT